MRVGGNNAVRSDGKPASGESLSGAGDGSPPLGRGRHDGQEGADADADRGLRAGSERRSDDRGIQPESGQPVERDRDAVGVVEARLPAGPPALEQEALNRFNNAIEHAVTPLRGPMDVAYIEPPEVWQRIKPHLERVCSRQHRHGMTVEKMARSIQNGSLKVWIWRDFEAVFLTSMYRQANGRLVLSLSWTVGNGCLPHHAEILPVFEAYARQHDCHAISATGRKGWEKTLRPYGYDLLHVTWFKEIEYGR